jgi:hypothetical protein
VVLVVEEMVTAETLAMVAQVLVATAIAVVVVEQVAMVHLVSLQLLLVVGVVLAVLRNLLIVNGERINYRALDVEQIGSVYEGIMGYAVRRIPGRCIGLKSKPQGAKKQLTTAVDLDALLVLPGASACGPCSHRYCTNHLVKTLLRSCPCPAGPPQLPVRPSARGLRPPAAAPVRQRAARQAAAAANANALHRSTFTHGGRIRYIYIYIYIYIYMK